MKTSIRVRISTGIMRQLKQKAVKERCSLNQLIQDALLQYLSQEKAWHDERRRAYQLFCEQPMKISASQLRHVLRENMWD